MPSWQRTVHKASAFSVLCKGLSLLLNSWIQSSAEVQNPCLLCSCITQWLDRLWVEWDNFEINCRSKLTLGLGYVFTIWPSRCASSPLTKGRSCRNLSSDSSFLYPFSPFPSPHLSPAMSFPSWFLYNGSSDLRWNCFILSLFAIWLGWCGLLCDWLTQVWDPPVGGHG